MPIVLASASPRRQELLKNAGIEFAVSPANIAEVREDNETPRAFAERMAREKAHAVHTRNTDKCVLAADTVVVVEDQVLGKPKDGKDAVRMLRLLSGRKHNVITGVCLLGNDFEDVRSECTTVQFSDLNGADIDAYVASGEPMDKAGAYAIQEGAARWISKIEGDYSNVVGLPVDLVLRMLREHRIS
jgi:septum formation protein